MFFIGFNIFPGLTGLIMFPLAILAALWTYKDAQKGGFSPLLWAGISFSVFPIGYMVYLIYRALARQKV